jgi:hypothetical protein
MLFTQDQQAARDLAGEDVAGGVALRQDWQPIDREEGDRVEGEHSASDVAVAARLVAAELLEVDLDCRSSAVEVDRAAERATADHGVVRQREARELLRDGERHLRALADHEGDAGDIVAAAVALAAGAGSASAPLCSSPWPIGAMLSAAATTRAVGAGQRAGSAARSSSGVSTPVTAKITAASSSPNSNMR